MIGCLRLLLAVSVLIRHTSPIFGLHLVGGNNAVRAFFLLSGFFIALSLHRKYNSYITYIVNRFLRLYPLYALIAVFTIVASYISLSWGDAFSLWPYLYRPADGIAKVLICLCNLTMFSGLLAFFQVDALGHLSLCLTETSNMLYFILVTPAWALTSQIMFYLIAPLLVRRHFLVLIALAVGSYLLRFPLLDAGLDFSTIVYRFFPAELVYFVMGILAYQVSQVIGKKSLLPPILIIVMIFGYQLLPYKSEMLLPAALTMALPFSQLSAGRIDKYLGDLSYPVFLSHFMIAHYVAYMTTKPWLGLATLVVTIPISIILLELAKPIEKMRVKLASSQSCPKP